MLLEAVVEWWTGMPAWLVGSKINLPKCSASAARDFCTCHLALLAAFRASIGAATAAWLGFTWGATKILCIMLPQEQRGLIPHSTSLDATT
jgi:hypothetical protein